MINRAIPGQMTDEELYQVIDLAKMVPKNGVIVEVGSLYGLSAWHLSKYSDPTVTIFCIDPFERAQWVIDLVEGPQNAPPFSRAAFELFTSDCHNIVPIQGYSPDSVRGWGIPIDLYLEDAVHQNPILRANIDFWSKKVRPGGIVSGHDYSKDWPDVVGEVNSLSVNWKCQINLKDTFWHLKKPTQI
jgi:hypothetical protein